MLEGDVCSHDRMGGDCIDALLRLREGDPEPIIVETVKGKRVK